MQRYFKWRCIFLCLPSNVSDCVCNAKETRHIFWCVEFLLVIDNDFWTNDLRVPEVRLRALAVRETVSKTKHRANRFKSRYTKPKDHSYLNF